MDKMDLLSLLKKKKKYFQDLTKLLQEHAFVGEEWEAEHFISYMQEREEIFENLKEIDSLLYDENYGIYKDIFQNQVCTEAAVLKNDIQDMARKVLEHDKRNEELVKKIMNGLKGSLKGIHAERNISTGYNGYMNMDNGMYFDQKN